MINALNDANSEEQLLHLLDELEGSVHQIDAAADLDVMGGLQLLVSLAGAQQYSPKVHAAAMHVLGASVSNVCSKQSIQCHHGTC